MLHILPPTFEPVFLQMRLQGLFSWVIKCTTLLFNSFCSKAAKQVAHFVLLVLPYLNYQCAYALYMSLCIFHVGHVGAYDNMVNWLFKHTEIPHELLCKNMTSYCSVRVTYAHSMYILLYFYKDWFS